MYVTKDGLMESQLSIAHLVISMVGLGVVLGTGLVIYAHKNFITQKQFDSHREDVKQRDSEIKEWLVRIEHKLDALIQK